MKKKWVTTLVMGLFFFMIGMANAATVFLDDFEDGNASGWLETASGSGSTGVDLHNSSMMAFANHRGNGQHSLSHDFSYSDNAILSFDMHAVAYNYSQYHASSGVKFSFLNNFNVELGSAGFINATDTDWLGANDHPMDANQHSFNALMSEYAALAEIDNTDSISTFSLIFFAKGSEGYGHNSSSTVWFDNIAVDTNAVPVPGAVWLFGSGLIALVTYRKKIANKNRFI